MTPLYVAIKCELLGLKLLPSPSWFSSSNSDGFLQLEESYLGNGHGKVEKQAKLYIPSTLKTDLIIWHPQWIVAAIKY